MPSEEIRAVLAADDPAIVRRYLELHRERMEEWLAEERRILGSLEEALVADSSMEAVQERFWPRGRIPAANPNGLRMHEA